MFEKRIWNRNAAYSSEEVGILNDFVGHVVSAGVEQFTGSIAGLQLNPKQRKKAQRIFLKSLDKALADGLSDVRKACTI